MTPEACSDKKGCATQHALLALVSGDACVWSQVYNAELIRTFSELRTAPHITPGQENEKEVITGFFSSMRGSWNSPFSYLKLASYGCTESATHSLSAEQLILRSSDCTPKSSFHLEFHLWERLVQVHRHWLSPGTWGPRIDALFFFFLFQLLPSLSLKVGLLK